jgi:hypothetical protein
VLADLGIGDRVVARRDGFLVLSRSGTTSQASTARAARISSPARKARLRPAAPRRPGAYAVRPIR